MHFQTLLFHLLTVGLMSMKVCGMDICARICLHILCKWTMLFARAPLLHSWQHALLEENGL